MQQRHRQARHIRRGGEDHRRSRLGEEVDRQLQRCEHVCDPAGTEDVRVHGLVQCPGDRLCGAEAHLRHPGADPARKAVHFILPAARSWSAVGSCKDGVRLAFTGTILSQHVHVTSMVRSVEPGECYLAGPNPASASASWSIGARERE